MGLVVLELEAKEEGLDRETKVDVDTNGGSDVDEDSEMLEDGNVDEEYVEQHPQLRYSLGTVLCTFPLLLDLVHRR